MENHSSQVKQKEQQVSCPWPDLSLSLVCTQVSHPDSLCVTHTCTRNTAGWALQGWHCCVLGRFLSVSPVLCGLHRQESLGFDLCPWDTDCHNMLSRGPGWVGRGMLLGVRVPDASVDQAAGEQMLPGAGWQDCWAGGVGQGSGGAGSLSPELSESTCRNKEGLPPGLPQTRVFCRPPDNWPGCLLWSISCTCPRVPAHV